MCMKKIHKIAYILVLIGAIHWGIIGLLSVDVIGMIFDSVPMITRLIYVLVGLSGLYLILFISKKNISCCEDECTCTTCKTDIPVGSGALETNTEDTKTI